MDKKEVYELCSQIADEVPIFTEWFPKFLEGITDDIRREMSKSREQLNNISEELRKIRENGLKVYPID